MFRSRDKGQSWEMINSGLSDHFILCLASTSQDTVFAGTMRRGVFRLSPSHSTWESVSHGLGDVEVKSLLNHQGTLYAGTGSGVFQWNETDAQWVNVGTGLEQVLVPGLAMMGNGTLLAATAGKGLHQLDTNQDSPSSWMDSRSIFIDPRERLNHRYLRTIAVNEAQHIFLGTQDGGIFRSLDSGRSWTSFSRNLPNDSIRSIVPLKRDVLVATGKGIFRWKHSQRQWVALNTGLTVRAVQTLTLTSEGDLYAGTSSGAFRSEDEGDNWNDVSQGFGIELTPRHPYD